MFPHAHRLCAYFFSFLSLLSNFFFIFNRLIIYVEQPGGNILSRRGYILNLHEALKDFLHNLKCHTTPWFAYHHLLCPLPFQLVSVLILKYSVNISAN